MTQPTGPTHRYLEKLVIEDALREGKLAFISGPRQVGKTTVAELILGALKQPDGIFNFDDEVFRKIWLKSLRPFVESRPSGSVFVFDEVHKDQKWKSKIKGLYDVTHLQYRYVVTGSARLDFFRKSGDSLQGRYFPYRLHPLSLGETATIKPPPTENWEEYAQTGTYDFDTLFSLSGFPEPFFRGSEAHYKRWQRLYRERLIREDLRDLQNIRDLKQIENLTLLMRERAGGILSYQNLAEDLGCSFDSVKRWVELLETLYYCFLVRPYSHRMKNMIKKEPKVYFYDWGVAQVDGHRRENLIGSHLLKACHAWSDSAQGNFELFYLRDKQKREVDFLVTRDERPYLLVEVKSGSSDPTPALRYYSEMLRPKFSIQMVSDSKKERSFGFSHSGIQVMTYSRFLSALP